MRLISAALMIALSAGTPACPVSAEAASVDCAAKLAKAREDILSFYPPAAKAAGVQGSATVTCRVTPQNARRNCILISETPADQGFGDAALAIASATQDNPDLHLTAEQAERLKTVSFNFTPSPPAILPNLLAFAIPSGFPKWLDRPSADDVDNALKRVGAQRNVSGNALMSCAVADDGQMTGCKVVAETPAGAGFDRAAMILAPKFRMSPATDRGCPVGGSTVNIPFRIAPAQ